MSTPPALSGYIPVLMVWSILFPVSVATRGLLAKLLDWALPSLPYLRTMAHSSYSSASFSSLIVSVSTLSGALTILGGASTSSTSIIVYSSSTCLNSIGWLLVCWESCCEMPRPAWFWSAWIFIEFLVQLELIWLYWYGLSITVFSLAAKFTNLSILD